MLCHEHNSCRFRNRANCGFPPFTDDIIHTLATNENAIFTLLIANPIHDFEYHGNFNGCFCAGHNYVVVTCEDALQN